MWSMGAHHRYAPENGGRLHDVREPQQSRNDVRTFIAIELPEEVRSAIGALSTRLRAADARATWVRPENVHLTLRFLGDLDGERIGTISGILAGAYKGMTPFTLCVRGTGVFPNPRRPSVVWAGVETLEGGLAQAQLAAESAARAIGLPPEEKRFHPHLTLARIRDGRAAGPLIEALEREQGFDGGEFTVRSVSLFSSRLTPHGSIYSRVQEFVF
jgi:2'-5' RNA ligase